MPQLYYIKKSFCHDLNHFGTRIYQGTKQNHDQNNFPCDAFFLECTQINQQTTNQIFLFSLLQIQQKLNVGEGGGTCFQCFHL